MQSAKFLPEGSLIHTEQNEAHFKSLDSLNIAMNNETVVEGEVIMCDTNHNLTVNFCGIHGIIPRSEAALGIEEGSTREIAIISRVGKPIACIICGVEVSNGKPHLLLSRRRAQRRALSYIMSETSKGDVIPARVTHLEPFGAFVDIGCGNISLIGIESISVSRISHPADRFKIGNEVFAVISGFDYERQRVFLSHRELLGTWKENASNFKVGQTVCGIVRSTEDYGIFIELAPNLSGLAEFRPEISVGDSVSVFIKSIIPEKMKIKLIIIDTLQEKSKRYIKSSDYVLTSGRITLWKYSPDECLKKEIISRF